MSFVPRGSQAVVTLAVVAFGVTDRLRSCLESLMVHESQVDFDVVVVVNPTGREREDTTGLPQGVHVIVPDFNLGWAGGLHAARHATTAPWMAWIQDDSAVLPGWLDAHMAAAEALPGGAAFGVVALDDQGRPSGHSGGVAGPMADPGHWNDSDQTPMGVWPPGVEERDWITSKGMLVRLAAWDEVGGPCPRQYPLNHVDKEFSTHLRAHGWRLYVVPGANVTHMGAQSSPGLFRTFLIHWQTEAFAQRWQAVVERLSHAQGNAVDHDCHTHPSMDDVVRECAIEATRMVVPLSRFAVQRAAEAETVAHERLAHASERAEYYEALYRSVLETRSWRATAPLRAVRRALRTVARRP